MNTSTNAHFPVRRDFNLVHHLNIVYYTNGDALNIVSLSMSNGIVYDHRSKYVPIIASAEIKFHSYKRH